MEKRPTKKQKQLLNYISEFITSNGYGPSYREIMRGLDYKSVSTVATHVNGLIARGWLVKTDNSARSLEVQGVSLQPEAATRKTASSAKETIEKKIAELEQQKGTENDVAILRQALTLLYPPKA